MEIKIDGRLGGSIESSIEQLKEARENICHTLRLWHAEPEVCDNLVITMDFNGNIITSNDTVDDAYLKIMGKTKAEADEEERKWREDYERREKEWEESIPSMVEGCCQMARGIIREDEYDFWDEIVPIRLGDLYHGMELNSTLEILKEWNESHSYKKCHDIITNQGHSGMSHGLVLSMVKKFAKGGIDSVEKLIRILDKVEYNENA